jgi:hydrogenase expression/formation protein HypD
LSPGRPPQPDQEKLLADISRLAEKIGRPIRLMEVCGTHTVAIFRSGLRARLPRSLALISGPGCPVCVTAQGDIDLAIALADRADVIVATYGDMMRVPGNKSSLDREAAKARSVNVVYSAADCIDIALANPTKKVVFLSVGFETTAPATAAMLKRAKSEKIYNLFILALNKVVPPALRALTASPRLTLDGFILPGHVSVIIGSEPYRFIADDLRIACAITGFSPRDIIAGIRMLLSQIADNRAEVAIQYDGVVRPEGNPTALAMLADVFDTADAEWRGLGVIPASGLIPNAEYRDFDASQALEFERPKSTPIAGCLCGDVLAGFIAPPDCPHFRRACTPETPLGPCMVSSEGTCGAYFRHYTE